MMIKIQNIMIEHLNQVYLDIELL